MHRHDQPEFQDGEQSDALGKRLLRRGRRFTPPGGSYNRFRRERALVRSAAVQLGDVVAELTPRQAVVWLMNLDTMVSLYESTTEHQLDTDAKTALDQTLRTIIREHRVRRRPEA